ncbi:MAG: protein BatD [Burkholderiales bacterium]|nr:protein BatD [Burkholderiales bacterium]
MNTRCVESARKRGHHFAALAFALIMCIALPASDSWAAVNARFSRNVVHDGDSATLTIEVDGSSTGEPDLAPLRTDFDVLGTSASTQFSFVNGKRSDVKRWVVQLQPRRTGTISVPPITVGNERTAALALEVSDSAPQGSTTNGAHVMLESEVGTSDRSVYVQQQIPYTVRLLYDDGIVDGELAAPQPDSAVVEQLGDDKRYTTTRNGREYKVIERRYAIAPEKSGKLRIEAAVFHGRAASESASTGGDVDVDDILARMLRDSPFANDPALRNGLLGGFPLASRSRPVSARGPEISVDVRPRPTAWTGHWLPAKRVTLHDSWADNPPRFKVGEPVTRTITVDVKGLAASQIPTIDMAQPEHARAYPEKPSNETSTDGKAVYGVSKQSVTYIPTTDGTLTVPAIELDWWNTGTDSASRTTLPAQTFNVLPGAIGANLPSPPPPAVATPAPAAPAAMAAAEAPQPGSWPSLPSLMADAKAHPTWLALGTMVLLGAIALLVFAIRKRRAQPPTGTASGVATGTQPKPSVKAALQALRRACDTNDPHAATQALLEVGRAQWPRQPPTGLRALANRVESGGDAIRELERSLYAANAPAWTGAALWNAFRNGLQGKRSAPLRSDDGLEPLYR